jgi:hypothetical protein
MSELSRVPATASPDLKTERPVRNPLLIGGRLIFWPLALLTLVVLAMQFGIWQKSIDVTGPFAAETDPPQLLLVIPIPSQGLLPFWKQPLNGDTSEKPYESRLDFRINGHAMGPPHTAHETIRRGGTEGFSHWHDRVIFALPPGVENNVLTTATLRYSLQPRPWVTLTLLAVTALSCWLFYREALVRYWPLRRQIERPAALLLRSTYFILFGLCCAGLAGAAVFVASSIYALMTGWALPTTALIRWWPVAEWAARNEPYLGYPLLTLAGLGTLMTWIAGLGQTGRRYIEHDEPRLRRLLCWSGLPIAACAYAFCVSAMWSGLVRPGDADWGNIGGLIPFSDAHDHLAFAFDQARDGTWDAWAMRRPFAAAFRSILLFFGQYSFPQMLLLQGGLVGGAAWLASCAIMAWRGVWAGVGFFALTYIYARIFTPTSLTEPLGLFWSLLSVPFFVDAFRSDSAKSALVAYALTTFALMTRMGNMFAIPALLLWLVWQFGRGMAAKARIGLIAICILLGAFGLNSLLQKAYGNGKGSTGSNFSFTLCGLTLGTTWDGCPRKLEAQGVTPATEELLAAKMYAMAWENFRAQPRVFFNRLDDAVVAFYTKFPGVIWKGYGERIGEPEWFYRSGLVLLLVVGITFVIARQSKRAERSFWLLLWASLIASAGFVYFDDGARVLAASHPLIALFLAMGFSNPYTELRAAADRRLPLYGSIGVLLTVVAFACIPWIAHRISSRYATAVVDGPTGDALLFGGKRMAGFLVVADGEPLQNDAPTIHLSDFADMLAQSEIEETYQGVLHPVAPALPFGFVYAPRAEKGVYSQSSYIVPAQVMERRDVPVWRFKFMPWDHKPGFGEYWVYVTDAQPWLRSEQ